MFSRSLSQTLSVFVLAASASFASPDWGYHGDVGPANWAELSPEFALCGSGAEQSPIDVPLGFDSGIEALDLTLASGPLILENNGHTVEAKIPAGGGTLGLDGLGFQLLQFHFHAPSEHTVDGEQFPLEVHFVHRSNAGSLAVVGVFVREGEANQDVAQLLGHVPTEEGQLRLLEEFSFAGLLPPSDQRRVARYPGSLTTPPCSEGVRWNLLRTTVEMSAEQIATLAELFSGADFPAGNRRPVQPLGERLVVTGEDNALCQAGAETLCLGQARFSVSTEWSSSGDSGVGQAVGLEEDSGAFWFFDRANLEVTAKVLDGCAINGHFWVSAAGLTDLGVELTVTDAVNETIQTYSSPLGAPFETILDVEAFPCD